MRLKKFLTVTAILLFSGLFGLFIWQIYFVYNKAGYIVDWHGWWITSHQVEGDVLYFRKEFNLPNNIKNAWLIVSASDEFELYLNGKSLGTVEMDGWFPIGVYDVTEEIHSGINTLGIRVAKRSFEGPVKAVLELGYEDMNRNKHYVFSDETWRVSNKEERGAPLGRYWYDKGFNDAGWVNAEILGRPKGLWLSIDPRVYTTSADGVWFWAGKEREISCQADIEIPKKAKTAWIRLASRGGFKLIVNKNLIDVQQDILGTENEITSIPSMQQTGKTLKVYEIVPFLNHDNTILINGYAEGTNRGLYVDGIIEGDSWSRRIDQTDFRCSYPGGSASLQIYNGDAGWISLRIKQIIDEIYIPLKLTISQYSILVIIFLISSVVFIGVTYALSKATSSSFYSLSRAYFVPSLFLTFIYILRYDARFYDSFPFQGRFLILSLCLVVLFWLLIPLNNRFKINVPARIPIIVFVLIFVVAGSFLRFKGITQENLQADEASLVIKAQGVLDHGYPSTKIAPDLPTKYVMTSELAIYLQALFFIMFGKSEFSLRLPMVIFGILTIPLLYYFGRMIGGARLGLLASATFCLLSTAIGMSHFARYPSQLAFFCLLAGFLMFVYLRTYKVKYLYLCALSFLLTYFSWQGSGFTLLPLLLTLIIMGNRGRILKDIIVFLCIILPIISIHLLIRFLQVIFIGTSIFGSSVSSVSISLMLLSPGYSPFFYLSQFFFIEGHQFLSILFFAGIPLLFIKFKTHKNLLFLYIFPILTLFLMSNFLELATYRYAYYLLPYLILSACGVLFMFLDYLGNNRENNYLNFINSIFASVMVVVISSGLFLNLENFPEVTRGLKTNLELRYFSETKKAVEFIKANKGPSDVIISYQPQLVGYYLDKVDEIDYFFESRLKLPVMIALRNSTFIPLHRVTGTPAILSLNELKRIIGVGERKVWFVVPDRYPDFLDEDSKKFIEKNRRVFFEGWGIQVYSIGGV